MRQQSSLTLLFFVIILMSFTAPLHSSEKVEDGAEHKAKLDAEVKELILDNATLEEAVLLLQEQTHANIIVDVKELRFSQYPFDKKLRLRLYDLELGKVLVKAYDESGLMLGYRVRGGVIYIAPLSALQGPESTVTLVYDVHDLTERFLAPNDLLAADQRPVSAGGPFSPPQTDPPSTTQRVNPALPERVTNYTRQENVDMLIRLILDCVDANSWRDNGGQIANVREVGGMLVVNQLPENQRQVESLLKNLRAMRAAIDRGDPDRGKGIDLLNSADDAAPRPRK